MMFSSGRDHSMLHTSCQFYQLTEDLYHTTINLSANISGHINFIPNQSLFIKTKIEKSDFKLSDRLGSEVFNF